MNKVICGDELNSIAACRSQAILPTLTPVICRTIDEIDECMRIRYGEYCLNRGWEAAHEFPDGRERDSYDERAVHILLMDNSRSKPVGTVRIIYRRARRDGECRSAFVRLVAGIPGPPLRPFPGQRHH